MVCAAGCEVAHVGGEEHAGDVGCVGREGADGDQGGDVAVLLQLPDVDVALLGGKRLRVERLRAKDNWEMGDLGIEDSLNYCPRKAASRRWRR